MTKPRITIVITTINVPTLLEGYAENFERYGHLADTNAIIVGDRKTPHAAVKELAERLTQRGFSTEYMDLEAQKTYMSRFPELDALIPYDSDNRRNIGYLKAVESGADIVVAVDDDNFVGNDDWYEGHSIVGQHVCLKTVSCSSGWFNPCQMMETDPPGRTIYARGYPYSRRHVPNEEIYCETEGRVVINAGLWLREPDVDSLTRLTEPVQCTRLLEERIMLAPGTWAPINTQNTAFHRDILPAFYFVPITGYIGGIIVERYGDIWAGLFARKAIDHMGDRVTYGKPACDHRRNPHVLLKDLEQEFWAILLTESLWEAIYGWQLTATTYAETYLEMADHLERMEWTGVTLSSDVKAYFGRIARAMRVWGNITQALLG